MRFHCAYVYEITLAISVTFKMAPKQNSLMWNYFGVVVVRFENSHSFIDSLDNHSMHQDPLGVDVAGLQGMQ